MKKLPGSAEKVYRELLAAEAEGRPCPTLEEFAERTYLVVASVQYGINRLIAAGYIRRNGRHQRNLEIVRRAE